MSVFISHDLADQQVVRQIAQALRKNGLSVWDNSEILPGDNWAAMTAQALEEAEVMVLILTPKSIGSEYVKREIAYAFGERRFENRVVPVLAETQFEVEVPWALRSLGVLRAKVTPEGQPEADFIENLRERLEQIPLESHAGHSANDINEALKALEMAVSQVTIMPFHVEERSAEFTQLMEALFRINFITAKCTRELGAGLLKESKSYA